MKLFPLMKPGACGKRAGNTRGFTIPEVMIASSVLLLVVGGVLLGNSFGMQMLGILQPKLLAHEEAKRLISLLSTNIAEARFVRVGNGDAGSFTPIADGAAKQGNALEIYSTTDTNSNFIRYFHDTGDNSLKRMTDVSAAVAVAEAVVNDPVFTAEDFQGQPLMNEQPRMTIGVVLDFSALPGSGTPIGTNSHFTSYSLNIKVAAGNR